MIDLNTYPASSDVPLLSLYLSIPPSDNHNYHSNNSVPKKKRVSVAWTKDKHMRFLEGLQAFGSGKWTGIARDYVITRNTTQAASHAQKHFHYQSQSVSRWCMRPAF
ncbi:hypothetical protein QJS10_CPB21g01225 [Acorus calamus]|uniref:HTH myb-type domain-containing protein n=1 Tax=Acorus calamus TaxID=4465 RepID=A0AAV9C6P2_ACOCL|nr:hypothetical protein QJS10_CPB21g01225 [Acorus calamus]